MVKQSGLGDNLYISGVNLSGDIQQINTIGGGPSPLDVTGIDKSGRERIGGIRDGGIDYVAFFNPTGAHPVLSALPTADQVLTYCRGTTLGSPAASLVAKELTYDGSRGTDGSFTFKVSAKANGFGLEWGVLGTAGLRTESVATNGTGVDLGAAWSASFGLQAYLHVTALTSGTPTVKLQGSNDDGATDPYADIVGGTFGVVTAPSAARIATASNLAVKRYFRVVTTGTFAGLTFAVSVVANPVSVVF